MDSLYFHSSNCGCGCGTLMQQVTAQLATFPVDQLTAATKRTLISNAIRDIYAGNTDEINRGLFDVYNNNYHAAVTSVFGTAENEQAQQYKINLSRLAAAKTQKVTAELERLRYDKNGNPRPWEEYKSLANKTIKTYNRYQVAEYNTITNRCRTAKQFEQFKKKAHLLPNIKWLRTASMNPRERHLKFAELPVILPVEHPFWLDNQPGNLYNCKCDWRQTTDQATFAPDMPDSVAPDKGLERNPAVTNEIVTHNHPYYDGTPNHIPDDGVLLLPDEIAYYTRKTVSGETYREHANVVGTEEDEGNRTIVELLLNNDFNNIRLLPKIHAKQTELRIRHYGKDYQNRFPTKCPDAMIEGVPVEFKNTTSRNMADRATDAAAQSDIVVLNVRTPGLTEEFIKRFAEGRIAKSGLNIRKLIIINDNKAYVFTKKAEAK